MKKTHKNYQAEYSAAIEAVSFYDENFDNIKNVRMELEHQLECERKAAAEYPEIYRLTDMMNSASGDRYRSGEADGKRVMTYEDYINMIVAETSIPEYGKNPDEKRHVEIRPAWPYTRRNSGRSLTEDERRTSVCETVICGKSFEVEPIESSDSTWIGLIAKVIERCFPAHILVKPERKYRRRLASSAAGIAWVMIFALVIALPVVLGVIKSDAISNLAEKKDILAELENEEDALKSEFESSLDLREIESIAMGELGMIKLNESTIRILRLNDIDTIESFSDRRSDSVVPALLSALGIRVGDE